MKLDAMMPRLKLIGLLVLAVLVVVLILQNTQMVTTHLLFITASMPMAVLLVLVLSVGFAGGVLTALKIGKRSM